MRSLSHSFLRSRALWHFLAVAGILTLPTPSLGSIRPSFTATSSLFTHVADPRDRANQLDQLNQRTPQQPFETFTEFAIAQADPATEGNGSEPAIEGEANGAPEQAKASDESINLQLGDTDPRVQEVQRLLILGGYYEGEPSGIFDISTDLAVNQFQEAQNLDITGIVDSVTWERLKRLEATPNPSSTESQAETPESQAKNQAKSQEEIKELEDTSSRPQVGAGSFSKLMLWLSLLIVVIGVVGMVFYWLLRVFEGQDSVNESDDFDELAPDDRLDLAHDEHTEPGVEEEVTLSLVMLPETETGIVAIEVESQPVINPLVTATNAQSLITPPAHESQPLDSVASTQELKSTPPETTTPEATTPETTPQVIPSPTPIQRSSPPLIDPSAQPSNPTPFQPPSPEAAISTASTPTPTVATTSLSPRSSQVEVALSPDSVSAKVSITERLLQDLHHPEPNQRKKAIWELGRRGDSRAIQPLVNLMLQSDSQQRSLILAVLAEINTRSLEPMQQALALSFQDDSPEVRKNALRDLTRIFDSMSHMGYFISTSLHDRDPSVRETAQWAMTQLARIRSSAEVNQIRPDNQDFSPDKK